MHYLAKMMEYLIGVLAAGFLNNCTPANERQRKVVVLEGKEYELSLF
jgi:hypothetical protein